jgi:predicted PurR-regulated permease PerM
MTDSHWKFLEPTHLVGAFVAACALSLLWSIVCLIASASLWGSPWGALLGPVLGTAHSFASLRAHLKARQRAFE